MGTTERLTRIEGMLEYPSIQAMREYFLAKAGSLDFFNERSFRVYVATVMEFMDYMGQPDPESALEYLRGDIDRAEETIQGYIRWHREKGNATSTQRLKATQVKRWTKVNGLGVNWDKIVIPRVRLIVSDRAPTKTELRLIMSYGRAWMIPTTLILASSGMRIGSLIKLRLKHLNLDSFPDIAVIEVPPEATKGGIGYFAAVTPEAREALEKSLERRREKGEDLGLESPLLKSPFNEGITYPAVRHAWVRMLKGAGLTEKSHGTYVLHIHTLRKFFRSQVEGILTKSIRETLMGHVSSEYLDRNYLRIPEDRLAAEYRKTLPALTIFEDVLSEEYQKKQFLLTARMLFPDKALRIAEILARHRTFEAASPEIQELLNPPETNSREARIVSSEEEMVALVAQGWDLERELNGGGFLLKRG